MGTGLKRAVAAAKATQGLTLAQRKGLEWFLAHGNVALFDSGAPSSAVRKRLMDAGLIETCGTEPSGGMFAFTRYRISQAGRAPSAMRTPISRVLWLTEYATTPYKPTAPSSSARAAKPPTSHADERCRYADEES